MYQKWIHNTWTHIVCVIFMCRDKNDTRPAIALEPRRLTPSGAHTSSIGPRTTIVSMWKPPHSSMTVDSRHHTYCMCDLYVSGQNQYRDSHSTRTVAAHA